MKRYLSSFCVMLAAFLMLSCAGLLANLSEPIITYTLTINGEEVIVKLPKDFPSMDKAIPGVEFCWDAKLCMQQFCLTDEAVHGHVRIFFSGKSVVALRWKNKEGKITNWLYTKGISVEVNYEELIRFLDSIWKKVPGSVSFTVRI